ncbi:MAG TPA: aminopeptidase P family protein [Geothrix sp.]|nr:aminopeptidase P family protein [Geothrix sp.]
MSSAQCHTERRVRLQKQMEGGLLLLLGNDESPMNYRDNAYPFRQDSTFLYFSGINRPGCAIVIDLDEDRTTLFADDATVDDLVWTGPLPKVQEFASSAGISESTRFQVLGEVLRKAQSAGRPIHFLPPYRAEHRILLQDLLGIPLKGQSAAVSVPFIRAVSDLRIRKSAEEVAEIERAVNTSVDMHFEAMAMARPGMKESDIAGRMTEMAIAAGGGLSYPVIATVHGEVLHNHDYTHTLKPGQLFLLDAGAETASGYAGDLTTTFPIAPTFTSRQRDIHNLVLGAFLDAVDALKPGVPYREIHLMACRTLAGGLKDLGLMKGNVDEAVELGAHALFFPCGLGHLMGLDVHDMENLGEVWVGYQGRPKSTLFGLKSLRLARELEEGYVLTVEPGIYFMPGVIDRWKGEGRFLDYINYQALDAYRDFGGLRIEEDFLITEAGSRRLGRPKPRTVEELEAHRS